MRRTWGRAGWRLSVLAVAGAISLLYVGGMFLNDAFDTAPIGWVDWLWCAGLASFVLWADEARKLVTGRRRSTGSPGSRA